MKQLAPSPVQERPAFVRGRFLDFFRSSKKPGARRLRADRRLLRHRRWRGRYGGLQMYTFPPIRPYLVGVTGKHLRLDVDSLQKDLFGNR